MNRLAAAAPPTDLDDDPLASAKRALLDLLVVEHQGIWSIEELDRHLRPSRATCGSDTEDALQELCDAGLAHRFGLYAFASRAAVAAHLLAD